MWNDAFILICLAGIIYLILNEALEERTRWFSMKLHSELTENRKTLEAYRKTIEAYKKEFSELRIMNYEDSSEMNELMADMLITDGYVSLYMEYKLKALQRLKYLHLFGNSPDSLKKIEVELRNLLSALQTTYENSLELYTSKSRIEKHKAEVFKITNLNNDSIILLGNEIVTKLSSIISQHDRWVESGRILSPDPNEN